MSASKYSGVCGAYYAYCIPYILHTMHFSGAMVKILIISSYHHIAAKYVIEWLIAKRDVAHLECKVMTIS